MAGVYMTGVHMVHLHAADVCMTGVHMVHLNAADVCITCWECSRMDKDHNCNAACVACSCVHATCARWISVTYSRAFMHCCYV